MSEKTNKPAVKEPVANITEQVLARVNQHREAGLKLPPDYSAENALKSAYLVLQDVKDASKRPVLESCSKVSVANSLFEMVVRGLSPLKKQCYFIAYGDKLALSPSYFGNIATAKRVGMKDIVANIIFENDVFEYSIDPKTGRYKIDKHEQKVENIDINKIKGAYAVIEMDGGVTDVEVMTIQQIKQSWLQGAAKGNSGAHQHFTDEMAKKSVINRACKRIINSSDDGYLYEGEEQPASGKPATEGANASDLTFTDAEVVESKVDDPKPTETQASEQPAPEASEQSETKGPGF